MNLAVTFIASAALSAGAATQVSTDAAVGSARELSTVVYERAEIGRPFLFAAELTHQTTLSTADMRFFVRDASGATIVETKGPLPSGDAALTPGDHLLLAGTVDLGPKTHLAYAHCTNVAVIAHGPTPQPVRTTCAELQNGAADFELVEFEAMVRDLVHDDIDVNFAYIVLGDAGASIPLTLRHENVQKLFGETSPVGARVKVTGVCIAAPLTDRRQFGRLVSLAGPDALRVVAPAAGDPLDVPTLGAFRRLQPAQIAALGRHRVTGRVLAVERGSVLIVRADDGGVHDVMLAGGEPPAAGTRITAVGFPASNMYRVNLLRAAWRAEDGPDAPDESCVAAGPREILYDACGNRQVNSRFHGQAIRLSGMVRGLRFAGEETSVKVECDGHLVEVDASACPQALDELEPGCKVEVSGICAIETEAWSPDMLFPHIRGFTLVLRTPEDVVVVARPPWWTTGRLVAAIGILFAAMFAVLAWNVMLRRASERRGRELAAAQVANVESELKVMERTRLAVELHDALSQNLAGVSFEIDAAERLAATDADGTRRRLASASHSLDSCRRELKNCLWDLRNNALEESDMNDAIRRTLAPHVDDDALAVRFNVPRDRFTDTTAHAVLCIIRELVLNAVRHGGATRILVAGSVEDGTFMFSVKDNGRGFDPKSAPGPRDGHYGLLGIQERVEAFEGEFDVESAPGEGCKATITLRPKGLAAANSGYHDPTS